MRPSRLHAALAVLAVGLLAGAPAAAQIRPADHDVRPPPGILDAGEQASLEQALRADERSSVAAHTFFELQRLRRAAGPGQPVAIDDFRPYPGFADCAPHGRFVLRRSVIDLPQFRCAPFEGAGAASFALRRDGVGGTTAIGINGGLLLVLTPGVIDTSGTGFSRMTLTRLPLALFVEAQGQRVSGPAQDTGFIRWGLKLDAVFEGGPVDELAVTTVIYRQTDMRLRGTGHGLKVTVTPQNARRRIGAAFAPQDASAAYAFVTPRLTADLFRSRVAGVPDQNWVGAAMEAHYVAPAFGPHGLQATAGLSHLVDLRSRQRASLGTLGAALALDARAVTNLTLTYRRGREYQTGRRLNEITAGLGLRF